MDSFLNMELKIAKEIINESKRKGKIYSYIDTIRGAGRHFLKNKMVGGGQGWTNWVTNTDDYNQDMAKRVVDITRIGVTKNDAAAPIPTLLDTEKLYNFTKLYDDFTSILSILKAQLEDTESSKKEYQDVIVANERYEDKLQKAKEEYEKQRKALIARKDEEVRDVLEYMSNPDYDPNEEYETYAKEILDNAEERLKDNDAEFSQELQDIKKETIGTIIKENPETIQKDYDNFYNALNSGGEFYKVIQTWNKLTEYLQTIIGYNKLSQSDKNKIQDKMTALIPDVQTIVNLVYQYDDDENTTTTKCKILLKRLIDKVYTPINDIDLKNYAEDEPHDLLGKPDTSGNVRRPFNPDFGIDGNEKDDDDDVDGPDDEDRIYRKASTIANQLKVNNTGIPPPEVVQYLESRPNTVLVVYTILNNARRTDLGDIFMSQFRNPKSRVFRATLDLPERNLSQGELKLREEELGQVKRSVFQNKNEIDIINKEIEKIANYLNEVEITLQELDVRRQAADEDFQVAAVEYRRDRSEEKYKIREMLREKVDSIQDKIQEINDERDQIIDYAEQIAERKEILIRENRRIENNTIPDIEEIMQFKKSKPPTFIPRSVIPTPQGSTVSGSTVSGYPPSGSTVSGFAPSGFAPSGSTVSGFPPRFGQQFSSVISPETTFKFTGSKIRPGAPSSFSPMPFSRGSSVTSGESQGSEPVRTTMSMLPAFERAELSAPAPSAFSSFESAAAPAPAVSGLNYWQSAAFPPDFDDEKKDALKTLYDGYVEGKFYKEMNDIRDFKELMNDLRTYIKDGDAIAKIYEAGIRDENTAQKKK